MATFNSYVTLSEGISFSRLHSWWVHVSSKMLDEEGRPHSPQKQSILQLSVTKGVVLQPLNLCMRKKPLKVSLFKIFLGVSEMYWRALGLSKCHTTMYYPEPLVHLDDPHL